MSGETTRVILRTASTARREIRELLAGVLTAELIAPSRRIWLVSPWIRNVDILDNQSTEFRGIDSGWGQRKLSLFELLGELVRRGVKLTVVTRPGDGTENAIALLRRSVGGGIAASHLLTLERPNLHAKGLLGDDYCISGSMNFTRNGIEHLDEMITYTTDPVQVGNLRIEFAAEYGEEA